MEKWVWLLLITNNNIPQNSSMPLKESRFCKNCFHSTWNHVWMYLCCFRASGVPGYLERHSQWEWAAVSDQRLPLKRRYIWLFKTLLPQGSRWLNMLNFYTFLHWGICSSYFYSSTETSVTWEGWNQRSYISLFSPSACMLVSGHFTISPSSLSVGHLLLLCF